MKMNPRISVIMGIYNCAPTLKEALDSLLAQTYKDFKVIMCNDGSKDNTIEIAQNYVDNYPDKFLLIHNQKNMGLNYTLNHCLEYADTEYVARMDGDDISLPERFEKEINFLDEHPEYAIVSTPMIYFDDDGDFRTGKGGYEPSHTKCAKSTPFCHAPCMVRTKAYNAVNGYTVDPKLLRMEDFHLWIKMFQKGFRGYVLSDALYKMRDDRNAYRRRDFKTRVRLMRLQAYAVKSLSLSRWNYIYCLRPIIVGLLPRRVYDYLHKRNK